MQPALIATLVAVGIIVLLVVIAGIYLWSTYNSLVTLKVRVDEAWSDITIQLKRRAQTPAEASAAEGHMQTALKSIFAVSEAYPQLQASQNFLQLQSELVDTEDKIQAARRFYNGGVREFNTKTRTFPNTLFVKRLGFTERDFFEVAEPSAIAEPPRVQF
jgi:LemA protein